jgi:hypothetical protein
VSGVSAASVAASGSGAKGGGGTTGSFCRVSDVSGADAAIFFLEALAGTDPLAGDFSDRIVGVFSEAGCRGRRFDGVDEGCTGLAGAGSPSKPKFSCAEG